MRTLAWWSRWYRSLPLFDPPATRIDKPPAEIARDIDAILYGESGAEGMLAALRPYVAVGEHARLFVKRTGLQPRCGFVCGPYPTDYGVPGCGLELVLDDLYVVHIIRRAAKTIGVVEHAKMSLSPPVMVVEGYSRHYHD